MELVEQALRGDFAAFDDLVERGEEAGLVVDPAVELAARGKPGAGDVEHLARELLERPPARSARVERELGHLCADAVVVLDRPVPDQVPRRVERARVVKQADPECGQRTDLVPRAPVRAAHLEEAFQAHFGKSGREVVDPVARARQFAGKRGELARHEVAEALPRRVDVPAVAEHEIHRHVEHVVDVAFVAESVLVHERQHAGAVGIGVGPDVAAVGQKAVGLAFGERRIGEQRRRERLQGQADAELLHHVGFGTVVEVGLDGARAQHHVEAHGADPRHVPQHDRVAALGHDRQLVAALVGPHAEAEEADPEALADRLHLLEVAAGFGARLVQVLERGARQLELAGGLEADGTVGARHRDDPLDPVRAFFLDRLPSEILERQQHVADAAGLVVGGRVMIGAAEHQLLVLGADPPATLRLLARLHRLGELLAGFDDAVLSVGRLARAHGAAIRWLIETAPA